jgi:hypothetical protein
MQTRLCKNQEQNLHGSANTTTSDVAHDRMREYERDKTREDMRVKVLEGENDEQYLAEPDLNETAWGLEDRDSTEDNPRDRLRV